MFSLLPGGVPSSSPTAPEAFCALFTGLGARTCIPDGMYWRPPPLTHGFPSTFSTVSTVPNSCFQLWCHRRDGTHVFLWFCKHIILTSLLIGSEMEFWVPPIDPRPLSVLPSAEMLSLRPPLPHGPLLAFTMLHAKCGSCTRRVVVSASMRGHTTARRFWHTPRCGVSKHAATAPRRNALRFRWQWRLVLFRT